MKNGKLRTALPLAVLFIIGVCFVAAMIMLFDNSAAFRTLFSGDSSEVVGEVAQNSPASIAAKTRMTAWISMLIFSVITALQFLAFGLGFAVISKEYRKLVGTVSSALSICSLSKPHLSAVISRICLL
jgi:hypothetical protein